MKKWDENEKAKTENLKVRLADRLISIDILAKQINENYASVTETVNDARNNLSEGLKLQSELDNQLLECEKLRTQIMDLIREL